MTCDNQKILDWLIHTDWLNRIDRIGAEQWVTIYQSYHGDHESFTFFCALIPLEEVNQVLETTTWDLMIGEGLPGCVIYYREGKEKRNTFALAMMVLSRSLSTVNSMVSALIRLRYLRNSYCSTTSSMISGTTNI